MFDGAWGYAKIEQSALENRVENFTPKCNRFMGAWCTKAMGGESSNQFTTSKEDPNLISEWMLNIEFVSMENFDLAWMKLFWSRMGEIIRDPTVGLPRTTTLRAWLDRRQVISKGLLSNPIFESCREACWYIVQGSIKNTSSMLSERSTNPNAFEQLRPKLAEWNHFINSLRRAGRILGSATRIRECSMKDVVLMLGKIQHAAEDDVCDQICLACGHAAFRGFQLLMTYGRVDVAAFPQEMHAFQPASALYAVDL